jgi:hypothetical protein
MAVPVGGKQSVPVDPSRLGLEVRPILRYGSTPNAVPEPQRSGVHRSHGVAHVAAVAEDGLPIQPSSAIEIDSHFNAEQDNSLSFRINSECLSSGGFESTVRLRLLVIKSVQLGANDSEEIVLDFADTERWVIMTRDLPSKSRMPTYLREWGFPVHEQDVNTLDEIQKQLDKLTSKKRRLAEPAGYLVDDEQLENPPMINLPDGRNLFTLEGVRQAQRLVQLQTTLTGRPISAGSAAIDSAVISYTPAATSSSEPSSTGRSTRSSKGSSSGGAAPSRSRATRFEEQQESTAVVGKKRKVNPTSKRPESPAQTDADDATESVASVQEPAPVELQAAVASDSASSSSLFEAPPIVELPRSDSFDQSCESCSSDEPVAWTPTTERIMSMDPASAAIAAAGFAVGMGLMNPEQSSQFMQQTRESWVNGDDAVATWALPPSSDCCPRFVACASGSPAVAKCYDQFRQFFCNGNGNGSSMSDYEALTGGANLASAFSDSQNASSLIPLQFHGSISS